VLVEGLSYKEAAEIIARPLEPSQPAGARAVTHCRHCSATPGSLGMNLSDETLMAYADGELDDATRQQIREAINRDPEIARRVASHQALRDSLRSSFEPVLAEAVPDRLLAAARSRRLGDPRTQMWCR